MYQTLQLSLLLRHIGSILRKHGYSIPLYTFIALLFSLPIGLHPRAMIGGQVDVLENYWNLWWTKFALFQLGQNPFHGSWMHAPFGLPLYFHTYNFLNGLLSLPLQVCCGTAAAYNGLILFTFVMAGLGMYALVWYLTHSRSAAAIAGLIYAFSPYMAFHLKIGQTNLTAIQWMPFYLFALFKGLRERWLWLLGAALAIFLNALTDWHYVIFELIMTGLVALSEAVRLRRVIVREGHQHGNSRWMQEILLLLGKLLCVVGMFAVLISPVLVPMVAEALRDPSTKRPLRDSIAHSTDLLAFLLPSPLHPLWGRWTAPIFYGRFVPQYIVGGIASVGFVTLGLAAYGVQRNRALSMLFVLIAGVGTILALGPYLQVNGVNSSTTSHPIPLPYLWFHQLPFMDNLRFPSRFIAMVMLALAVLAGLGVASLAQYPTRIKGAAGKQRVVLACVAALVLFEYWPAAFLETPIGPEQVSPFYQQLGSDPGDYSILEVPYLEHPSLLYQTYHHKPTVGGRIARPKLHPWFDARFFGPLIQTRVPWNEVGADNSSTAWRAALACENVRYVVFYKHDLDSKQQAASIALQQAVFNGVTPVYEDATLRAYGPIKEQAKEPFWTLQATDWHDAESMQNDTVFRWLKSEQTSLMAYPCGQTHVLLRFTCLAFAHQRTLDLQLNGQSLRHITLAADSLTTVEVPITLQAGENRIELRSPEPPTSGAAEGRTNDQRLLRILLAAVSMRPQ